VKISFSKGMNFGSCYRDRIGIISDILEVANWDGGASRTRIMYNANLSHDQMKHYLRVLTENYFLYYNLHTQRFKATEKGLKVIEAYKRIEDMVRSQQVLPQTLRQRPVRRAGLIEIR
jgi:predicted transcriptional regulator